MFKITGVRLTFYPQWNYKTIIIVLGVVSLFRSKPSRGTLWKSVTMNQFLTFCLKVILFIPIQYSFQLRYGNVTSHSLLYSWKGSTCNYLVSYEQYDGISYEDMLCFFSTNNECSHVLHKLICVNQFLTACFSSYNYVAAIRDAAGKVYVVSKHVQARFVTLDNIDVCPINSHCSRCFSVTFLDEFMNVRSYSCALAHNKINIH